MVSPLNWPDLGLILTEKVLWRETKTDAGWQLLKIEVIEYLFKGSASHH